MHGVELGEAQALREGAGECCMQGLEASASSLQRVGSPSREILRSSGEALKTPHVVEVQAMGGLKSPFHN